MKLLMNIIFGLICSALVFTYKANTLTGKFLDFDKVSIIYIKLISEFNRIRKNRIVRNHHRQAPDS